MTTAVVVLTLLGVAPLAPAEDVVEGDPVLRAMEDELARSMEELRFGDLERPYFVAYRVDDGDAFEVAASFGAQLDEAHDRERWLSVEVRVGDRELDNTNFLTFPSFSRSGIGGFGGMNQLPLEDDYRELRRQLWLTTDAAYKQALEDLAQKKAALQNRTRTEEIPDFSEEEPFTFDGDGAAPPADAAAAGLVTSLSALFKDPELAGIHTSRVRYERTVERSRYLNSEGSRYTRTLPGVRLVATASTQAPDGMPLEDAVVFYGRTFDDLPPEEEIAAAVRAMGRRLVALGDAALLDRYNGPVLFEGQAAAELFAQSFAPELLARRKPIAADERLARAVSSGDDGGRFQDRLGARVLPRSLSVVDDPTRDRLGETPLRGGYPVDDQGVPASPTTLIQRGYLKTLLTDRTPIHGVERSTGNARAGGVAPSNLLVTADRGLSPEELREELLLLVQDRGSEFGVVVRRVTSPAYRDRQGPAMISFGGGGDGASPILVEAYQVFPDGREVPLRNVEISGLTATTFKEIVAVSEAGTVHTVPFKPESGNPFRFFGRGREVPVSLRVPDLLFEELTLKKPSGEIPKPPVAEHPFFGE